MADPPRRPDRLGQGGGRAHTAHTHRRRQCARQDQPRIDGEMLRLNVRRNPGDASAGEQWDPYWVQMGAGIRAAQDASAGQASKPPLATKPW